MKVFLSFLIVYCRRNCFSSSFISPACGIAGFVFLYRLNPFGRIPDCALSVIKIASAPNDHAHLSLHISVLLCFYSEENL